MRNVRSTARQAAIGVLGWMALVAMVACASDDVTQDDGPIGSVQQALQGYGDSCNFGPGCEQWLHCCGTFPNSVCRCGHPDCTTCSFPKACSRGVCWYADSMCCVWGYAYCDDGEHEGACMDIDDLEAECSCYTK